MIENVVLIGGASPDSWPDMSMFNGTKTKFIGIDRGSLYGIKAGYQLNEVVGDFDSLSEEEWQWLQTQVSELSRCAAEKDDTDMELGVLKALDKYPDANYYLIGATGGRLDHYLSNIWLPLQERFIESLNRITIMDELNTISYYLPGEYTIEKEIDKTYLAFICLTEVKALSLYDAKYTLDKVDFPYPRSLSSNEFVGDSSRFSFESGVVSVIQSKDKKRNV